MSVLINKNSLILFKPPSTPLLNGGDAYDSKYAYLVTHPQPREVVIMLSNTGKDDLTTEDYERAARLLMDKYPDKFSYYRNEHRLANDLRFYPIYREPIYCDESYYLKAIKE